MLARESLRSPIKLRLAVTGAIISSFLAALLPLVLLGPEGLFWIAVLGTGGLPLLVIAALTGLAFSSQIAKAPWRWAIAAGIAGLSLACIVLGLLGGPWWTGLFGAPVAALAVILFPLALRALRPVKP